MGQHTVVVHATGATAHIKVATEKFVAELKKGATVTGATLLHGGEIALDTAAMIATSNLGAFGE